MAWRCEIRNLRTGEWFIVDEERGEVGKRLMGRARYEQYLRRDHPHWFRREYRITQFDAPKVRTLFTMSIPLPLPWMESRSV